MHNDFVLLCSYCDKITYYADTYVCKKDSLSFLTVSGYGRDYKSKKDKKEDR